jgi:pilus assembly protein Flp/PilA
MYVLQMARLALRRIIRDEDGATAVEYGLIVALIAVVIAGTVTDIGQQLLGVFGSVKAALPAVAAGG